MDFPGRSSRVVLLLVGLVLLDGVIDAEAANESFLEPGLRVVGGLEVPVGRATYVTGIRTEPTGRSFCGGSLISPRFVLTAAHCVPGNAKFVAVGTHYASGDADGQRVAVAEAIVHPRYDPRSYRFDFMLLKLATPIDTRQFAPVVLAGNAASDLVEGTTATVRGWGQTSPWDGEPSDVLLEVGVDVWSKERCRPFTPGLDNSMLCAGGVGGEDACRGDSGGPLTVPLYGAADVQLGVVSFGRDCAQPDKPGVYARVTTAAPWIRSIARDAKFST